MEDRDRGRLEARVSELEDELAKLRASPSISELSGSLAAVVEAAPMVLWALDQEGVILLSEGRALAQLGLVPGQLVGANVFDVYKDFPAALVPIRAALRGEEGTSQVEVGGATWENRYFPRAQIGGVPNGVIGISMDISSRVHADNERRLAEERFRSLVQESPDAIMDVDTSGKLTFLNRGLQGAPVDSYYGAQVLDFVDGESRVAAKEALEAVWSGAGRRMYESVAQRENGEMGHFRCRVSPIIKGEEIVGATIVATDITEERRSDREKALLQAQVQHSQKLESLGVLAGGIAHDFNNLLSVMMGHADLARASLGEEHSAQQDLAGILQASERAAELCEQMLAYSGGGIREKTLLDLSLIVKDMSQLLKVSLGKGVDLRSELARNLPAVQADGAQIQQVLLNLLTNASDALLGKSGTIRLRTGVEHCSAELLARSVLANAFEPGDHVYIEVTDDGCGMSATTKEKMFDPFYTTKTTGRGLGMAAVLGIIDGHRGALMVDTEPGKGTTVRALFPATAFHAGNPPPARSSHVPDAWGRGRTVLIVDDEEGVRRLAKLALEDWGFVTISAEHGKEALEILAARGASIDLVILDVTMPVMDGLAALEVIRRKQPDLPVILSSGYQASEEGDTSALDVARLPKPYRIRDLRNVVHEVLSK